MSADFAIRLLAARAAGLVPRLALRRAGDLLALWRQRRAQRHRLTMLGDHLLRDMGLSRGDARAESEKPFWRS